MIRTLLEDEIREMEIDYGVCGIVDQRGNVYPLGSDTKVLSTVFEILCKPVVISAAQKLNLEVEEQVIQNHYPDFTLMKSKDDIKKIAIDVKTTYRSRDNEKFKYTLGSYTSFIKDEHPEKNIAYPFNEYANHIVIGFVYNRVSQNTLRSKYRYEISEIEEILPPFKNVKVFVQEKWRIAGDKPGSGNTANIGSIRGHFQDFVSGNSPFLSEKEFLNYWKGYERTKKERNYSNVEEFRNFQKGIQL